MNTPKVYHLFVYGSLLSGFKSPAYDYISHYFTLIGPGKIKGRLYDMGDYPAAVPAKDDIYISGELYLIKNEGEFSWAIGQLDDYEGVIIEPGELQLYHRTLAEVYIDNDMTIAWVYFYSQEIRNRPLIESGDILQYRKQKTTE